MKNSFVSIYILSHNYGRFIQEAIESVLNQTFDDWFLYLVDDASTDETWDVIQMNAQSHNRIEAIRFEQRQGLQKITNLISQKTNSTYFMRLDADDWLLESALASLSAAAQKYNLPNLVYGSYFYVGQDGHHIAYEAVPDTIDEDSSLSNPSHGACTLIRKDAYRKAGGLFEDINAQDGHDLWFKLVKTASDVASIKAPIFYYRQHNTSISKSDERVRKARNSIYSKIASDIGGQTPKRHLAIIPIKNDIGDFKDISGQIIDGRTVAEHAFQRVIKSTEVTDIIISSPDQVALVRAKELMAKIKSQASFAIHYRKTSEFKDVFELYRTIRDDLDPDLDKKISTVSVLNVHNVHGQSETLDGAIARLRLTNADICLSARIERAPILRHASNGLEVVGLGRHNGLFSHDQELLRYAGGIISFTPTVANADFPWQHKIVHIEPNPSEDFILTQIS